MLFLTGATGKLGRFVLDKVLAETPANKVRAMARNPDALAEYARRGVDVVRADYDEPDSIKAALKGIHTALLISSSQLGRRAAQHKAFLEAACRNAVARLVYTSVLRADVSELKLAEEHFATEEAIRHTGIPTTILRNGWYLENYTDRIDAIRAQKGIVGATHGGKISAASREDYAEAAAHVLLHKGGVGGTHELAGDTAFTLQELVDEIGHQTNEHLSYTDVDEAKLRHTLEAAHVPAGMVDFYADCDAAIARGDLEDTNGELQKLLGRPTTTLRQAVSTGLGAR